MTGRRTLRRPFLLLPLLLLLALAAGGARVSGAAVLVTFGAPTPAKIPAPADYAHETRGYWWDFSNPSHFAPIATRGGFGGRYTLSDGWFAGTTTSSDPKIWLLDMNILGTNPTPNEGQYRTIDTARYRYFTFRFCTDQPAGLVVYWFHDASNLGAAGFKQAATGCGAYTFDLVADRLPGEGNLNWTDMAMQTLAIKPFVNVGANIRIDFATLSPTPPSQGPALTINWTPTASQFSLYYATDPTGAFATPITSSTISGLTGSYAWNAPNLPPGTYYIVAKNGAAQAVSPPFVVNSPPDVTITAPSYTSGPDYATTVLGNPWDMSDPADVMSVNNITAGAFSNSTFCADNTTGDPGLLLNVTTPIDTRRFYYVTYSMLVSGPQDIQNGSVLRLLWWNGDKAVSPSTTKDVVIYEGWQTVSFDLRTAFLEPTSTDPWGNSEEAWLRFDPHEFQFETRRFCVDDVKLTGNDRPVNGRYQVQFNLADADRDGVTRSVFFDTDRSGTNGQPITCLPGAGGGCLWDVSGVPNGTYYIYVQANDGTNVTTAYSDTPVEVGTLDTTPPTASLALPAFTPTTSVAVKASGSPDTTGYYLGYQPTRPTPTPWTATPPQSFALPPGDAAKKLYLWTEDAAGNISSVATATTVLDTTRPTASLRLAALTSTAKVNVTASGADANGINGWFISQDATAPAANAGGWLPSAPATFTLAGGDGAKTVFLWTRDPAGNVSAAASATTTLKASGPTAALSIPARTNKRLVSVSASGAGGVTGYFISEQPATPAPTTRGWSAKPPTQFLLSAGNGAKTVFLWTKDGAGNISPRAQAPTLLDASNPKITAMTVPGMSRTRTVAIKLTATDDGTGVAGYLVTELATPPAPSDSRWSPTAPATFKFSAKNGKKTLWAWVKDGLGNVSAAAHRATLLDTRPPRAAIATPKNGGVYRGGVSTISGIVQDPGGAAASGLKPLGRFAILQQTGSVCRWWNRGANKLVAGDCAKPLWFNLAAKSKWSAPVGKLKARGTYQLLLQFTDIAGNQLRGLISGVNTSRFTIR